MSLNKVKIMTYQLIYLGKRWILYVQPVCSYPVKGCVVKNDLEMQSE